MHGCNILELCQNAVPSSWGARVCVLQVKIPTVRVYIWPGAAQTLISAAADAAEV